MTKAIFFDKVGGYMQKCLFAGIDNNGKAQWLVVNQGEEVITLSQYMERNGLMDGDVKLLCIEGEKVSATTMAFLLGAVIEEPTLEMSELTARIVQLQKWGVKWQRDSLNMSVHVLEYMNERTGRRYFCFSIVEEEMGLITEAEDFETLDDLMSVVRCYFNTLEFDAGISINSKELVATDKIRAQMDGCDREMFEMY